jgi:hypothetical protein
MDSFAAFIATTPQTLYAQPRKNANVRLVLRPQEMLYDVVAVPDFPDWWEGKYITEDDEPTSRRGYVYVRLKDATSMGWILRQTIDERSIASVERIA